MRGFGAPALSTPALVSSFKVAGRTAYTVAALGPDPGLQVEVLTDGCPRPRERRSSGWCRRHSNNTG